MAKDTLQGLSVAILVTDGFEQVELTEPRRALAVTLRFPAHATLMTGSFRPTDRAPVRASAKTGETG